MGAGLTLLVEQIEPIGERHLARGGVAGEPGEQPVKLAAGIRYGERVDLHDPRPVEAHASADDSPVGVRRHRRRV
jgi:hypothetical protein